MSGSKTRASSVILILVLLTIGGAGVFFIVQDRQNKVKDSTTPSKTDSNQSTQTADGKKYATTSDFKYLIPEDWAAVDKTQLQAAEAVSGIATLTLPITQFRVAVVPASSSPSSLDDFKEATLETIQRFQNFKMISDGPIKVSGQDGYRYTYKLGSDGMAQQDWIIVLHKNKAFSLLFTGPETNFKEQAATMNSIITSFQLL